MINTLLLQLNIDHKREGSQLLSDCFICGKEKHCHIAPDTGLWHCKVCGEKGNPYKIIQLIRPELKPAEIFALLKEHGLTNGEQYQKQTKKPDPQINKDDIRHITDAELLQVCESKRIDPEALKLFTPFAHTKEPMMLLPAFWPNDLSKATGWLRCRFDGQLIQLGQKLEKYPMVAGSSHGLFGLKSVLESDTIIVAEGWRDALAAITAGYNATASSGGSSTWNNAWLPAFKGKTVYIIMDRDKAGESGEERFAKPISTVATAYIVRLPYEYQESGGKDLYDYLTSGGDMAELLATAKEYKPKATSDEKYIVLENDLYKTVAQAFEKWSIEKCGVIHRYNQFDGWFIHVNERYQKITDIAELEKYIRDFISDCIKFKAKKKDPETGEYIYYNASPEKKHQADSYIRNVISWLRSLTGIHLKPSQKAPCSLVKHLDPNTTLALTNGLLDVSNCKHPVLYPHTSDFITFNYLPVAYDPDKTAPTWLEMCKFYFDNDTISIDVIHSWQKRFLFRRMNPHAIFALIGAKRSGKGTIGRITVELIGKANTASLSISAIASRFGLENLHGKQLGVMWDARLTSANSDIQRAVEILLQISGEDMLDIDRKNKQALNNIELKSNILILSNKMINLRDDTGAMASRFQFLETNKSFFGQEDPTLEHRVKTEELSGLLNIVLDAPDTIVEHHKNSIIRQGFEEMSSPQIAFVNEWCVVDPDEFIPKDLLYLYWKNWAIQNEHCPGSPQTFKSTFRTLISGVNPDFRPRLNEEQITQLKYEFRLESKLDQKVRPSTILCERPFCFQGITIKEDIKNSIQI